MARIKNSKARMKPWYWPVTTTIYKLSFGFILGIGSTELMGFIFPLTPIGLRIAFAFGIAAFFYLTAHYEDWL